MRCPAAPSATVASGLNLVLDDVDADEGRGIWSLLGPWSRNAPAGSDVPAFVSVETGLVNEVGTDCDRRSSSG